jgi:predicted ATPase
LLIRRGAFVAGSALLRSALDAPGNTAWKIRLPEFLGVLAEGLAGAGQFSEARVVIDEALTDADRGGRRWPVAELIRIKGGVLFQQAGGQPISAVEDCFLEAFKVARQQGALLWELRAAVDLARLRVVQGRPNEARHSLTPVYERFTEGFETADLRAARAILESLPPNGAEPGR